MNNPNYSDAIIKQSQAKLRLMKEKMLEPVIQVQQSRKQEQTSTKSSKSLVKSHYE